MLLTWLPGLMDECGARLALDEVLELEVLFLLHQLLGQSFHLCAPSCLQHGRLSFFSRSLDEP